MHRILLLLVIGLALLGSLGISTGALLRTATADDAAPVRPKRGRHLDLTADRHAHDFGFAKQDAKVTTTFTYTNTSDAPVKGIRARGECGCNRLKVTHEELKPGESGTLTVEFDTHTLGGRMRKRVRLTSGEFRRGELSFELDIAILAGLVVRPSAFSFRDVSKGTTPTKSVYLRWYQGQGKPFKITSVTVPGFAASDFAIATKPWVSPKDPKWQGWQIDVKLLKKLPLGMFSATVVVRTTHKQRARVDLPLSANVTGKIWMQSRGFSFGLVRLPSKKRSSLKLKPYTKDVVLGKLRAVSRMGKVLVDVIPDPYMADIGMWKMIARVADDAPLGSLADEVIELHTGVPGEEVVLLTVRGQVLPPKEGPAPKKATSSKQGATAKGDTDGR